MVMGKENHSILVVEEEPADQLLLSRRSAEVSY